MRNLRVEARDKKWVTAVTVESDWGQRTVYLRTEKATTFREWDQGVLIKTEDELLMYVKNERLVSIEFDAEDPDNATEG